VFKILNIVVVLCLIFSRKAYAYLDLGTGSYIFQLIIGFFLGGLFVMKIFWKKIEFFLKKLFSRRKKT